MTSLLYFTMFPKLFKLHNNLKHFSHFNSQNKWKQNSEYFPARNKQPKVINKALLKFLSKRTND